jgi:hypothetical protein
LVVNRQLFKAGGILSRLFFAREAERNRLRFDTRPYINHNTIFI